MQKQEQGQNISKLLARRGFTLIELLVVIAIVAILAVVVILAINPSELLKQARDSQRLSELATLTQAISLYQADTGNSIGSGSTVYVSVPDTSASCANLGLPTLPTGWSYACAATSTYRKIDGTGWIPVNFTQATFRSPLGQLPIDPVNTTSTENYYSYVVGGTGNSQFEVSTLLESQRYQPQEAQSGSPDLASYSLGSNLQIAPFTHGLVGYWNFEEGSGGTAYDLSGMGNNGTWYGTSTSHYASGKVGAYAGYFNGTSDYLNLGNVLNFATSSSFSIVHWFKLNGSSDSGSVCKSYPFNLVNPGYCIRFLSGGGEIKAFVNNGSGYGSGSDVSYTWNDFIWHQIAWVIDRNSNVSRLYIDGQTKDGGTSIPSGSVSSGNPLTFGADGGQWFLTGLLDDIRIYNRALSAAEIQAIYNATK